MNIGNVEVYGIIYKITNKINNKSYIGQTTSKYGFYGRYCLKGRDIERVYKYHKSKKEKDDYYNEHLLSSIEKYGYSSFEVIPVLDVAFSKSELDIKEKMWISYFNSYNNGYNKNLGGEGNKGMIGLKGSKNPASRSVVQLTLEGDFVREWDYISRVEKELGILRSKISSCCTGTVKSAGGFMWVYSEDYTDDFKRVYTNNIGEYNKKSVVKLTLSGEYIGEYQSISEACKLNGGLKTSSISRCCKGERKTYKNYIWVYKDDYCKDIDYSVDISKYNKDSIVQLSLDGDFIAEYEKASDALKVLNTKTNHIGECCRGTRPTFKGYRWQYSKDYYS